MSKFIERMERITQGGPGGMGFGSVRTEKPPGMALVGHISKDHAAGLGAVTELGLDAVLLAGIGGPEELKNLENSLPSLPWGIHQPSLNEEDSAAYREQGCDLLAFSLADTSAAVIASDDVARVLYTEGGLEDRELRGIASLPLDVFVLRVPGLGDTWLLEDLASIAMVGRRVDKFVLVEVSRAPTAKDLEALRNAGVHGLVVDLESMGAAAVSELKTACLNMPRKQPDRRGGLTAIVPSSVFPSGSAPEPDEDDEDDE